MKRIKLYALFLLCWLSSVAYGQISPQNTELPNVQRFIVEAGTYAENFGYVHTQDTRLTTDAYRPDGWEWQDSPNDVFYRFTLEKTMRILCTSDTGEVHILEEDPDTGRLVPVPLIDFIAKNFSLAELKAGTYYVVSESRIDENGSFTNGEIVTRLPYQC